MSSRHYHRHQDILENKKKGSSVNEGVLPPCSVVQTDYMKHSAVRAIVTAVLTASAVAIIRSSDENQCQPGPVCGLLSHVEKGRCHRTCAPSPKNFPPFLVRLLYPVRWCPSAT